MQAKSVENLSEIRPDRMAKINLFETPRFFCDVWCLAPGQAQKVHAHAGEDKLYHVLEGEGAFQVGTEEETLGPGWTVFAPAGEDHGVRNDGIGLLRLLVFMAPHPRAAELAGAGSE